MIVTKAPKIAGKSLPAVLRERRVTNPHNLSEMLNGAPVLYYQAQGDWQLQAWKVVRWVGVQYGADIYGGKDKYKSLTIKRDVARTLDDRDAAIETFRKHFKIETVVQAMRNTYVSSAALEAFSLKNATK